MKTEIAIGFFDLIMLAGVFQGILLSVLFFKNNTRKSGPHLFQGFLMLALSMAILEEFLNNTGLIVKVLPLVNFAEPLNLAYGPLFFLYIKASFHKSLRKQDLLHLALFGVYLLYMILFFAQPETLKYNEFIHSKHPGWAAVEVNQRFSEDPLGIRNYINTLTGIHILMYLFLSITELFRVKGDGNKSKTLPYRDIRNTIVHLTILVVVFIVTKLSFERDLGDYFISTYITLMFFITSYRAMNRSAFFDTARSFMDVPTPKYRKSSLTKKQKDFILTNLDREMEENHYYANHLASLADLAKRLNTSAHHLSQVINEKKGGSFYEMIARYRVHMAKDLLRNSDTQRLTIIEIAEKTGYNSKSAFNTAFKKMTGMTPSAYRKADKDN